MRRLIASALLLFLLAGISAPLALALTARPPHACCLRDKPHCHSMHAGDAAEHALYAPSCGNDSCCRALSATHWAHPQGSNGSAVTHEHQGALDYTNSVAHSSRLNSAHSVRGPPQFS